MSSEMVEKPRRVQLSRKKGWKMPENTVHVARPSRWGNPFVIGEDGVPDAASAVAAFRELLGPQPENVVPLYMTAEDITRDLRGKNLACWCRLDAPCHADVLLELANDAALKE